MAGLNFGSGSFFGMRDTEAFDVYDAVQGRWISGKNNEARQRPENLDDMLLYLYPNNKAMLTALLTRMSKKPTTDPLFGWTTKCLAIRAGSIGARSIYTDSAFLIPYVSGGIEGTILYIVLTEDVAQHLRPGNQVLLQSTLDWRLDVNAKVLTVECNSNASYCSVRLLEADDNAPTVVGPPAITGHTLADCDYLKVIGNINPEGSGWPTSRVLNPTEWQNYTQIFINPIEITRTALQTKLKWSTDGGQSQARQEILLEHAMDKELAFLYGVRSMTFGQNGHPERTTMGLLAAIKAAGHVSNYAVDTDPIIAGLTWENGWYLWLTTIMERCMRYGETRERMCYLGPTAWMQLMKAFKNDSNNTFSWTMTTKAYGINVMEVTSPFGTFYFQSHPLMAESPIDRNAMIIFDPSDLIQRSMLDTTKVGRADLSAIYGDLANNRGWTDSFTEGYISEVGLEFHHPMKCAYLTGFGEDNVNGGN